MPNDLYSPDLTHREEEQAVSLLRPRAALLYEVVRQEGEIELNRTVQALWWSGIAAGLSIGFSVLAMAFLQAHIPQDFVLFSILTPLGYSAGFLIVVLARQQLFTENTITAALPVMSHRTSGKIMRMMRLWGIVLAANLTGTIISAAFLTFTSILPEDVLSAAHEIGQHIMHKDAWNMFYGAIAAGWLIAAMVWVLPAAEGNEIWIITFFTYLISLIGASHIIAGSVEIMLLVFDNQVSLFSALTHFAFPTLTGNIIGGTTLFALISYAQVQSDKAPTQVE